MNNHSVTYRFLLSAALFFSVVPLIHAQYQINGSASQLSCNCYQLTPDTANVGGSVWNVNQIDLNTGFDFYFDVWLGCDEWGADGIAFVLQPVNVAQGGYSSSLGYGGISPSLIVEIDIWPNDQTMMDPQADHIAIMQNGSSDHASANNLAGPVQASAASNNIEDCQWHQARIVWDPSINSLTVYFDGAFRTSYTGDVINNIFSGNSQVYWGWTGGTGGASADQRFCNAILPDYSITSSSACAGSQIDFEDASHTSSGNISNYSWDFGDGATGSGPSVSHTYVNAGTFDVTLSVTTEGCSDDTVIPITINPVPVVDVGADIGLCQGESVQLNSPNTLGSGTYSWTPSTGLSNAAAPSPTAFPSASATYTLTYTSSNGCSGSDAVLVTLNPLPTADAGTDAAMCEGTQTVLSASGGVAFSWSPANSLNDPSIAGPIAQPASTTTYTVTVTDANNCSDMDDVTVTVVPQPALNAGSDENICSGDAVQFNAQGNGQFLWSPPAGLDDVNIPDPMASPTTTIVYHVLLTDANNCTATDSLTVSVDPVPVAYFDDPMAVCDGNPVLFSNNSTGNISTYIWNFGDGQLGQGTAPQHTYAGIGVYTVTLTTVSPNGCNAIDSGTAEVVTGPIASFTVVDGPDFCESEQIGFNNSSSGPIATYEWDFGDAVGNPSVPNSVSSDMEPQFSYPVYGDYTITLTVVAADNCLTSSQQDVQIHPKPVTDFSTGTSCSGQPLQFTDLSTVQLGSVNGWEWLFGDNTNIEYAQNPAHIYSGSGIFQVRLISQTDEGCRDTMDLSVHVNPTPQVIFSTSDICLGSDAVFINSTVPIDSTIVQWNWSFGDGQSATGTDAAHQYANFGPYTTGLTAISDSGCTASASQDLTVFPNPVAGMSLSDNQGCAPFSVDFTNGSTIVPGYSIGSYLWDFGDGQTSDQSSVGHTYGQSGNYEVSLVAIADGGGCTDTLTVAQAVYVYVTPSADFSFSPTNATMLDPRIRFTDHSLDATEYQWDFGDGNTSDLSDPMNTYPAEGDYPVTLIAINGVCTSTTSQWVHINPETFVYIPNAFTPNDNGNNDGFTAYGIGIEEFDMSIYDRWGTEMYHTASIDMPWDGTYLGKKAPKAVYVYRIELVDVMGENRSFRGYFTLVR